MSTIPRKWVVYGLVVATLHIYKSHWNQHFSWLNPIKKHHFSWWNPMKSLVYKGCKFRAPSLMIPVTAVVESAKIPSTTDPVIFAGYFNINYILTIYYSLILNYIITWYNIIILLHNIIIILLYYFIMLYYYIHTLYSSLPGHCKWWLVQRASPK